MILQIYIFKMADDLGDEWWLHDEENDDRNSQNLKQIHQSKFSMYLANIGVYVSLSLIIIRIFYMTLSIFHLGSLRR